MGKIKVLVVDDSAFMRKMISNILEKHEKIIVVGTARDGLDALKKIDQLEPDLVTLDIEMPKMDGLTALRKIMQDKPRPVIMLSSFSQEGASKTFEAMELGAVDFISKPSGPISLDIEEAESEIVNKVLQAMNVKLDLFKESENRETYSKIPDERIKSNLEKPGQSIIGIDRKSTRLNSSHVAISYAVFCLKKKHT